MKNLKKISRNELKKVNGAGGEPASFDLGTGGCGSSSWCACGSVTIDLGLGGGPKEECCACPPKKIN
ncbi:bacteriocin-like protein [Chryseobacterium sp. Leaf201]|uniref:bacteriocin-like protein n=1 Tax=Chryseobacterium sp. Leaf201 TaxID=1735672 RepID=UPI00070149E1|nr:hypothetical protein [Chryseobacterium sp. Leaf201]KQM47086.1 hypothetical protein ASE55_10835 [Chryseobacterium sp. Leaf201]